MQLGKARDHGLDREPLLFDVEGEQVGETPATITCLPSAIAVHAPLGGDQFQ